MTRITMAACVFAVLLCIFANAIRMDEEAKSRLVNSIIRKSYEAKKRQSKIFIIDLPAEDRQADFDELGNIRKEFLKQTLQMAPEDFHSFTDTDKETIMEGFLDVHIFHFASRLVMNESYHKNYLLMAALATVLCKQLVDSWPVVFPSLRDAKDHFVHRLAPDLKKYKRKVEQDDKNELNRLYCDIYRLTNFAFDSVDEKFLPASKQQKEFPIPDFTVTDAEANAVIDTVKNNRSSVVVADDFEAYRPRIGSVEELHGQDGFSNSPKQDSPRQVSSTYEAPKSSTFGASPKGKTRKKKKGKGKKKRGASTERKQKEAEDDKLREGSQTAPDGRRRNGFVLPDI